ncbi:MAG TPA: ferrochelatase [bacterium]|nr:ferrochelatase [bacterium]
MPKSFDAILLIGFGGPEKPEDVVPFLEDVTAGRNIPPERLKLVAKQYEQIGGVSPYNRLTREQAEALQKLLKSRGLDIPVVMGFAHYAPRVADTLTALARQGKTKIFAIIMAPHRSPASYDKYVKKVDEALESLKAQELPLPEITYAPEWHNRPGFIHAIAQNVQAAYEQLSEAEKARHRAELILTAHSIPRKMALESPYAHQLDETCQLVTHAVGMPYYQPAFTSRSGRPEDPWLEPDLTEFIDRRTYEDLSACVVAPVGFLVDHVEVLYDIDVKAAEKAKWKGLHMVRAKTVGTHPSFIAMLSSLVEEAINGN